MTQAIINNLNIQSTNTDKYMTNPKTSLLKNNDNENGVISIFEEIKNKICPNEQDTTNNISELKDTIKEVTEEANVENALDLTLARDVHDIINQLQLATGISVENEILLSTEITATTGDIQADNYVELNNNTLMVNADMLAENDTITDEIIKTTSKAITNEAARAIEEASAETGDLGLDEDALKELNIESLEAETGSFGEAGTQLQEQSANEHVVKVMLNQDSAEFEIKTPSQNICQTTKTEPTTISTNKIIEQITKQLEGLHNSSKLNIVLNPESLGKVSIQIAKSAEGMSAQFTVASQEAREILMKGIDGLKEGLLSHGIGVDNVSVKMNETQKSEYNQDWTEQESSNGGNKEQKQQNKDEKEKGLFEQMFTQINSEKNGNV